MNDGVNIYAHHTNGELEWLCECSHQVDAEHILEALNLRLTLSKALGVGVSA